MRLIRLEGGGKAATRAWYNDWMTVVTRCARVARASLAAIAVVSAPGAALAQAVPPPPPPEVVLVPETPAEPPPLEGTPSATEVPPPPSEAVTGYGSGQPPEVDLPEGEAPPRAPEPEHRGFFVRGLPGGGYLELSREGRSGRGLALGIGVQIGFAVVENLILFGEFWYRGVSSANGEGLTPAASTATSTLNAIGGGAGLGYYFMPFNFHVALVFDVAYGELTWDATYYDGRGGFGGHLILGKEWWLARQLGLGIAADVVVCGLEDYVLFGAGLLGTVTFN